MSSFNSYVELCDISQSRQKKNKKFATIQTNFFLTIVVINSLNLKFDVSNVRIIFHVDRFRNIMNYVQKNDRVDRNEFFNEFIIINIDN